MIAPLPEPSPQLLDVNDVKYQVFKEFTPCKETTWPYPPEKSGWMMAHNALRGQMDQFQVCLAAVKSRVGPLQLWEVDCIKDVFSMHYEFVEEHHSTEDNILAPEFMKRFKYPEKLTDDHEGIINQLEKVWSIVKALTAGDHRDSAINELDFEFEIYSKAIRAHFEEEETVGLPLSRAYFDPKSIQRIMKKAHKKHPPKKEVVGCFVHFNGVDSIREFMRNEGIPFFVWHLAFKPDYDRYTTSTLAKADALMSGVEYVPKQKGLFSCFARAFGGKPAVTIEYPTRQLSYLKTYDA